MEREFVEVSFRIVDEFGNERKLEHKDSVNLLENGTVDVYYLYNKFTQFLKASGFSDEVVNMIQFVNEM